MNWNVIESRQNNAVKFAASLADKKARDREGLFVAEGSTLFFDFAQRGLFPERVYLSQKAEKLFPLVEAALSSVSCEAYLLSEAAFERVTSEKGSEGIVAVYSHSALSRLVSFSSAKKVIALENVQDPGNVGTVIRTAASFGIDAVFLAGGADPFGIKAVRASMGAIAHVPVLTFPTTEKMMDEIERLGLFSVAACLHPDAQEIEKTSLSSPVCVLIGNEGKGLTEYAVSRSLKKCIIPICGMESLNAAVAATVFMWEMARQGGCDEK